MKEFKTYHPIVNFIYFVSAIGFSCFFLHPVCLVISLVCAFVYSVMLKGRDSVKSTLMYLLPAALAMALINPAFNHRGVTILAYLPGGNPLTLESIVYGLCAGAMISSVICHFSCYNEVMTSDKFIYLFGRIIPSLSLVLSMTLRFVPRFTAEMREVAKAQKCMGRDVSTGTIANRIKNASAILSAMLTRSLENSIDTADSMRSRGYGLPGRTSFSIFRFDKRDALALLYILFFGAYILVGGIRGGMYCAYFPYLEFADLTPYNISVFVSYLALFISPVLIEIREVIRWNALKSKI